MTPVAVGRSVASVERLERDGEVRFGKTSARTWDQGVDAEAARLRWLATTPLADRVASVVSFDDAGDRQRLVTTAVPGVDVATLAEHEGVSLWHGPAAAPDADVTAHLASTFGRILREVHETLDPAACPFDLRLDVRLAMAARRVDEAGVDEDDFEPEHEGRTAADLLEQLQATRPADEDLVVTHGDWCLPNVLLDGDRWGMVDLAGLGVGCRWYDLGIGSRSTMHNLGADAVPAFFAGYGIEPDDERIRYYVLLDELQ